MVGRRGFLAAGAGAAVAAGCGKASEKAPDQAEERLVTSVQGDVEMLETLKAQEESLLGGDVEAIEKQDRKHFGELGLAILRLKGENVGTEVTSTSPHRMTAAAKQQTIALYIDAIPKISDPKARQLAAGILTSHAAHLALLSEDAPAPSAFEYGKAPDA